MALHSLLEILQKIRSQNPSLNRKIDESGALNRWESAVGAAIAKHTRAIRVQDGTLWIAVDHPIWKTELVHRKRQILEILNASSGNSEVLEDLLFLDERRDSGPKPKWPPSG